jgi:hypothetical protein
MRTIRIAWGQSTRFVDAEVFGSWAVHECIDGFCCDGLYRVSHVDTGLSVPQLSSTGSCTDRAFAVAVAARLNAEYVIRMPTGALAVARAIQRARQQGFEIPPTPQKFVDMARIVESIIAREIAGEP